MRSFVSAIGASFRELARAAGVAVEAPRTAVKQVTELRSAAAGTGGGEPGSSPRSVHAERTLGAKKGET
jgi:hypothetical protein